MRSDNFLRSTSSLEEIHCNFSENTSFSLEGIGYCRHLSLLTCCREQLGKYNLRLISYEFVITMQDSNACLSNSANRVISNESVSKYELPDPQSYILVDDDFLLSFLV